MADQNPVKKGFIPKKIGTKVGPEQPRPEEVGTDITAVTSSMGPQAGQTPSMFRKKTVTAAAAAVLPPPARLEPPLPSKPSMAPKPVATATVAPTVASTAPIIIARRTVKKKPEPLPVPLPVPSESDDLPDDLVALQSAIDAEESSNPYKDPNPPVYYPEDRAGFQRFIQSYYSSDFSLPPILSKKINPNACSEMKLQTYKYQAFIREYMRQASPYRGVLVYHGLGSGKTCTSIAAAEALYGQGKRKIIVMTPTSLQENFINEIMFCGFRHFHIKNYWVPFSFTDPAVRLFAEKTVGIPRSHLESLRKKPKSQQVFWMPDMTKTEAEIKDQMTDFEGEWQQSAIREQLYAIIKHRITFIGYTGMTAQKLRMIAVGQKDFFDNAVIVIDEIHNLTRLMSGKIDAYFHKQSKVMYEPFTADPWNPRYTDKITLPPKKNQTRRTRRTA